MNNKHDPFHFLIQNDDLLIHFPDTLLQELLRYLSAFEMMEFSRVNNDLRYRLQRNIRELYILQNIKNKFYNNFQSRPFAMSVNDDYPNPPDYPLHDLQERLDSSLIYFPFSRFMIIQCSTGHIPLIVQYKVNYIHDLKVSFDQENNKYPEVQNDDIVLLSNALHESHLIIHKLSLFNVGFVILPVFQSVITLKIFSCRNRTSEEMNIHLNTSLRYLELLHCSVDNIDAFSHIYDVELYECNISRDPSGLYKNYRRTLTYYKNNTQDCSFAFQYPFDTFINGYNLQHIKKLELNNYAFLGPIGPLPSSLASLTLSSCFSISRIPTNNLRSITISNCKSFLSLENMSHIKSVTLSRLKITSLDGLGEGNQTIILIDCDKIRDWSAVKDNKSVQLKATLPSTQLLSLENIDYLRLALKEATHLRTNQRFIRNLFNAKRLKEIIVDRSEFIDNCYLELLEVLLLLPGLQKIDFKRMIDSRKNISDQRFQTILSKSRFSAHYSPQRLILLRR